MALARCISLSARIQANPRMAACSMAPHHGARLGSVRGLVWRGWARWFAEKTKGTPPSMGFNPPYDMCKSVSPWKGIEQHVSFPRKGVPLGKAHTRVRPKEHRSIVDSPAFRGQPASLGFCEMMLAHRAPCFGRRSFEALTL